MENGEITVRFRSPFLVQCYFLPYPFAIYAMGCDKVKLTSIIIHRCHPYQRAAPSTATEHPQGRILLPFRRSLIIAPAERVKPHNVWPDSI